MRRKVVEEVLGRIPAPEVTEGMYLIEILFKVGPTHGEAPITEADLTFFERRRGIELAPWQADTLVEMSRAYLSETFTAREWSALCPWPTGRKMWMYVQDQRHTAAFRDALAEKREKRGSRK